VSARSTWQHRHSTRRLLSALLPPRASGRIWSICAAASASDHEGNAESQQGVWWCLIRKLCAPLRSLRFKNRIGIRQQCPAICSPCLPSRRNRYPDQEVQTNA
jgi:hypothetical protein